MRVRIVVWEEINVFFLKLASSYVYSLDVAY